MCVFNYQKVKLPTVFSFLSKKKTKKENFPITFTIAIILIFSFYIINRNTWTIIIFTFNENFLEVHSKIDFASDYSSQKKKKIMKMTLLPTVLVFLSILTCALCTRKLEYCGTYFSQKFSSSHRSLFS